MRQEYCPKSQSREHKSEAPVRCLSVCLSPTPLKSLVEFSEQMATSGEDLDLYLETSRTSFAFRDAVVTRILLKTSLLPNSYPFGIHNHHIISRQKYPHVTQTFKSFYMELLFSQLRISHGHHYR